MACSRKAWQIGALPARLSAGIGRLSSQQAFSLGLALGASGTGLGALLLARRQRLAGLFRRRPASPPALGVTVQPARAEPKPIPALAAGRVGRKLRLSQTGAAQPIPVLAPAPTKLEAASVQVQTRRGPPFVAAESYRVMRADGADTGLAITPYLEQGDEAEAVIKAGAWSVTHTGSGALIDGPYASVEQAQGLATTLSALPWTGAALSRSELARAKRLIQAYRQSLDKAG